MRPKSGYFLRIAPGCLKREQRAVAALWGVKNHDGEVLQDFTAASRIEVGRKVVPTRYDAFRLQVSSSYRELFNRALSRILGKKHWRIVRVR
jgi:hypothetical protein